MVGRKRNEGRDICKSHWLRHFGSVFCGLVNLVLPFIAFPSKMDFVEVPLNVHKKHVEVKTEKIARCRDGQFLGEKGKARM